MRYKVFLFLVFLLSFSEVEGQLTQKTSTYKVEFESFSPPVKDVISSVLYSQAQNFMAPDIFGKTHILGESKSKNVILWFSDIETGNTQYISALQDLYSKYGEELEVFYFSNDTKKNLLNAYQDKDYFINIMFNSKMLAEAQYESSLGYPRMFLLDEDGYIIKILPKEYIENVSDIGKELDLIIAEGNKSK